MIAKRLLLTFLAAVLLAAPAAAQFTQLIIPAGSDADKATAAINAETDVQKRITLLQDFVQKFAGDKIALAYGYQMLAQQYQMTGEMDKALAAAEQAFSAVPDNMDIVTTVATAAQSAKNAAKVVEYSCKGAMLVRSVQKTPKPDGVSDAEFAARAKEQAEKLQPQLDFFETAAYNAIANEDNPKTRMAYIEQFMPAFPGSKFTQNVGQFAMFSLQQMNQPEKMADFGEKVLAANPNDVPTLVMMASALAEEKGTEHLGKASEYAKRAIELTKAKPDDKQAQLSEGVAHSELGWVLMRQEKTLPAITELKATAPLLKDNPEAQAPVLYRLGYAYAKLGKLADAKSVLAQAVQIPGPYQGPSKELLEKVNSAKPRAR